MIITRPIIFFDTETTGVNIQEDRIVSIATIKIFPTGEREEKKYLINPEISIPKEASEIHGIYDEDVKDLPKFRQMARAIYNYFFGCDIGGFNSNSFDIPILAAELQRSKIDFPDWDLNLLDGFSLERILNPRNLGALYQKYTGKELEDAHDAMSDIEATLTVLEHQIKILNTDERFPDGELTVEQIDQITQGEKKRFDIAGKCSWKDDEVVWNFGKNIGKPVLADLGYLDWVCGPASQFPFETVQKLKDLKNKINE